MLVPTACRYISGVEVLVQFDFAKGNSASQKKGIYLKEGKLALKARSPKEVR